MNAIRMISWIHILWGVSLMFLGIQSRPFGQLEAFLVLAEKYGFSHVWVGLMFVSSGLSAIFMLRHASRFYTWPILVPLALVPQQMILFIALLFAAIDMYTKSWDDRLWYAGVTQIVFALFHGIGMYVLYKVVLIDAQVNGKKNVRPDRP